LPVELTQKVARLKKLSAQEKEIKSLKEEIKSYLESAQLRKAIAGDLTVSYEVRRGRDGFDAKKLTELVGEDVVAECKTQGDSYSFIKVA
jgi:hypothetical protein